MSDLPEITPEKVADDVEVVLTLRGRERDGFVWAMTHRDEEQARGSLSGDDTSRFVALVRVRVPRSLLRQRWTEVAQ